MLGSHFYNEITRKNIIAFGTLFNNITLRKKNPANGDVLEEEKVPLAYGPKQKFLARLEQNPEVGRKVAITLPRLYFEMTGIEYDASRKTSPIQKYKTVINNDGDEVRVQYVPVPYNMNFDLGIIAKSQDDALQIVEQIIPYFQPSFSVTLNMIPDMNEKKDVAIVLNDISYEDEWEDDYMQRRFIVYTLRFTARTYFYGPYSTSDIIRQAIIHETVGDAAVNRRAITRTYTPVATTDLDGDNDVDAADTAIVTADDDFGFNEGITIY
jgi:hypothetical protein